MELTFGSYHLRPDPTKHEASWGARLIFAEVKEGSSGVVWDRQTPTGDSELVKSMFPLIERWTRVMGWMARNWRIGSDANDCYALRDGLDIVVGSPQGSFGYLYVTAVHEYLPRQYSDIPDSDGPHERHDLWPMVNTELLSLDQRVDEYRTHKWTGIRELKARHAELERLWG